MKNFKKTLALVAAMAMAGSTLAACTGSEDGDTTTPAADGDTTTPAATDDGGSSTPAAEGDTLTIYCWNDEFQSRVKDFYPGSNEDASVIDGVNVNWVITPNENNAYQNKLDADLLAGETIDIFLVEADYALKYVDSDYSVDVTSLGLTEADMADMYQYTKDIVTDSNGVLKGVTWQATPGLFAYRRDIAREVLGTDDPAEVQKAVADWDTFAETAATMKESGYCMLSGYDDAYRTFSNNVSTPWVVDGKIVVDDNLMAWVDQTKEFTDKGYNNKTSLWDDNWAKGQGSSGNVFGYFYSTWGINFTLLGNSLDTPEAEGGALEKGNGLYGEWAVCEGPQSYYWGGTWICASSTNDNPTLIANIMKALTCDAEIMKAITEDTQDYTNNQTAMNELASSDFQSDFLGGQNHIALFAAAAPNIDMSNIGPYDQGCNEEFQKAFKDYFDGNVDKDTALANFYSAVEIKYPELTH